MDRPESPTSQSPNLLLEEYKILVEDRRFLMTRYMQGLALYIALMGIALRILMNEDVLMTSFLLVIFLSAMNILAVVGADRFRSMALHVMDREKFIANKLGMKEPHSMLWGYWVGIFAFLLGQFGIAGIVLL